MTEAELLAMVKAHVESHRRAMVGFAFIWMVIGIGVFVIAVVG